jgi:TPR repeat protein
MHMKIYPQIVVACLPFVLLSGLVSYEVEGAQKIEPYRKPTSPHDSPVVPGQPSHMNSSISHFSTTSHLVDVVGQPGGMAGSPISAAAQFHLGQMYAQGEEVTQDDEEAAYYYKKAANLGDARAQINLGVMYANGRGVQKNFDEAIYWIHQASNLAQLSWHDTTVSEAVSWLKKASEHGYTPAGRTLELMRDSDKFGGENSNESIFWFRKSAGLGDASAQTSHPSRLAKQDG